jgi:hypothetical protein
MPAYTHNASNRLDREPENELCNSDKLQKWLDAQLHAGSMPNKTCRPLSIAKRACKLVDARAKLKQKAACITGACCMWVYAGIAGIVVTCGYCGYACMRVFRVLPPHEARPAPSPGPKRPPSPKSPQGYDNGMTNL